MEILTTILHEDSCEKIQSWSPYDYCWHDKVFVHPLWRSQHHESGTGQRTATSKVHIELPCELTPLAVPPLTSSSPKGNIFLISFPVVIPFIRNTEQWKSPEKCTRYKSKAHRDTGRWFERWLWSQNRPVSNPRGTEREERQFCSFSDYLLFSLLGFPVHSDTRSKSCISGMKGKDNMMT
jgi:hypothetical protein